MNFKKVLLIGLLVLLVVLCIVLVVVGKSATNVGKDNDKLNVVVTNFSAYDFVKHILGDKATVTFLLNPGVEAHSYDPTAKDLIKIKNADVFIYIGGETEQWMNKIFDSVDLTGVNLLSLLDTIELSEEIHIDGALEEAEHEENITAYNEHIWTSPKNAIEIMKYLEKYFSKIDEKNALIYEENAKAYIKQIQEVQASIKEICDSKIRNRLVFGDKMPMQYFVEEYGLTASAAFNGCSTQTEASSSQIAYLVNLIKEEKIPVVLYIELSNGIIAKTIAEETGAQMLQIQTLHNISKDDFDAGENYVSLMMRNVEVLKKALQ